MRRRNHTMSALHNARRAATGAGISEVLTCPGCATPQTVVDGVIREHVGPNGVIVCKESGLGYQNALRRRRRAP